MGYCDEIDVKQFALYLTPGIVIYSYGYLLPSMMFRWIGILMALCILVLFSVTGGDCRVDPIEDQPAKNVFERKSDRLKTRRSEHHNAVKPICIIMVCIIMGIVIFSYGDLLPRIWRILFKCIGSLMVLGPLAAQQEDSERKSLRWKTCIPISENHLQKSRIPISENLRKNDMLDRIEVASLFIVGIVTYSYSYLMPRSLLMLFQCTGLLNMLLALAVLQDSSERKILRSKTRRSEYHNAVKPVSNGSEKIVRNSSVPVVSEDSKVSWALFKKQLAKNPLGEKKAKSLGEKKQGKTVQPEPDKAVKLICIIMGIVIFSYGDLLPRIWRIFFKCIGFLMVLGPSAAQQEDSERKSLRSKTCIPLSENLTKADIASLLIVGIVTYSYGYLTPRSLLMLFQCTGLSIVLFALAVLQEQSERKSLRSKTRRSEHHNAVKPVSNGSEKIVKNQTGLSKGSMVPVVSEDSKVSRALLKKQLAKNPPGKPGRGEAIAEAFGGCITMECVIKKAKSLGEKKSLDVKKHGKTVQPEPDKAPMLEAKWGGAMQTIQLCCGTRYSCFAWKPYENEAFGGQWNKSAVNVAN